MYKHLFYFFYIQAGPIEKLNRKFDRNGQIISLVTYKHFESCDYAIKLFNNLNLFGQQLRVQFSQNSMWSKPSGSNLMASMSSSGSLNNLSSGYSNQQPKRTNSIGGFQQQILDANDDRDRDQDRERDRDRGRDRDRDRGRDRSDRNSSRSVRHQERDNELNILPVPLMSPLMNADPVMINQILLAQIVMAQQQQQHQHNSNGQNPFNRSKSGPHLMHEYDDRVQQQHHSRRADDFARGGGREVLTRGGSHSSWQPPISRGDNNYNNNPNQNIRGGFSGNLIQSRQHNHHHNQSQYYQRGVNDNNPPVRRSRENDRSRSRSPLDDGRKRKRF